MSSRHRDSRVRDTRGQECKWAQTKVDICCCVSGALSILPGVCCHHCNHWWRLPHLAHRSSVWGQCWSHLPFCFALGIPLCIYCCRLFCCYGTLTLLCLKSRNFYFACFSLRRRTVFYIGTLFIVCVCVRACRRVCVCVQVCGCWGACCFGGACVYL